MRLGLALFDALDYKKDSNEELLISTELENLIGEITLDEADGNIAFTIDEIYDVCVLNFYSNFFVRFFLFIIFDYFH